jgi:hypothetical protein
MSDSPSHEQGSETPDWVVKMGELALNADAKSDALFELMETVSVNMEVMCEEIKRLRNGNRELRQEMRQQSQEMHDRFAQMETSMQAR